MRDIFILSGPPGAGKTTFIKSNGLDYWTITPDDVRKYFLGLRLNETGKFSIVFGNNAESNLSSHDARGSDERERLTWKFVWESVERKMLEGETIFVDATHTRRDYINRYLKLAEIYRYKVHYIRFEATKEELVERNKRRGLKNVPEDVIERMLVQLDNLQLPKQVNRIKPEEVMSYFEPQFYPVDVPAIWVIGDIHGVAKPIKEFLDKHYNDKDLFVFIGDLIDRGENNVEVLKIFLDLYKKPNVQIIMGNHDRRLCLWAFYLKHAERHLSQQFKDAFGVETELQKIIKFGRKNLGCHAPSLTDIWKRGDFLRSTYKEFVEQGLANDLQWQKEIRQMCRKMADYRTYFLNGQKIFINHAGVPTINNIGLIPAAQMWYGVGPYEMIEEIETIFATNHPDVIQFHGHRNPNNFPIRSSETTFNLDGGVEFGGELRAVRFTSLDDYEEIRISSDFIAKMPQKLKDMTPPEDPKEKVKFFMAHPMISLKHQRAPFKHIVAINFSREAFYKRAYSNLLDARGLFWDTQNEKVAARGYRKFFYIGEGELTRNYIEEHFDRADIYQKYNGFLLIVSYYPEMDTVIWATKSVIDSEFVDIAKKTITEEEQKVIEDMARENQGYSFLFEVVNPELDPHIIDSPKQVILLDAVKNSLAQYAFMSEEEFLKLPWKNKKQAIAKNVPIEEMYGILKSIDQRAWKQEDIEGAVIWLRNSKTGDFIMVKHKTPYYKMWKRARTLLHVVAKRGYVEPTKQGFEFVELIKIASAMNKMADRIREERPSIIEFRRWYKEF